MQYFLAHDLGTSGNKATLFSEDGELVHSVTRSYKTFYKTDGWAEQNPEEWWRAVCECSRELAKCVDPKDVAAISFSGHMMGCVCVDSEGRLLRDAIIWADIRAHEQEEYVARRMDRKAFYNTVGHRLSCSYSLSKYLWIKQNQPEIYKKTYRFLNSKDYIVLRMTGEFLTDHSDASGTNAYDITKNEWSEEIISAAGLDQDKFPRIVSSLFIAGTLGQSIAEELGLAVGTAVVVGGGDGSCASVGAGSVECGKTYNCLGSSSWISTTSAAPIFDDAMRTVSWAHVIPGLIVAGGTMQSAGASVSWAIDQFCRDVKIKTRQNGGSVYDIIEEEIAAAEPASKGLIFLPYMQGERCPRWDIYAKGMFCGLTLQHDRSNVMRAVYEGVAYNLRIILSALAEKTDIGEITVVGGLARSNTFLQILADVFDMDILRLNYVEEATSIGAAVIAGVAVNAFKDFKQVDCFIKPVYKCSPIVKNVERYKRIMPLFEDAYNRIKEVSRLQAFV